MNGNITVVLILCSLFGFAIATGVFLFYFQRLVNPEPSLTQKRLEKFKAKRKIEDDYLKESDVSIKMAALYKGSDYQNAKLGRFLDRYAYVRSLKRNLYQAGKKVPIDSFFIRFYIAPVLIGASFGILTGFFPLFLLGIFVPAGTHFYVKNQKQKRLNKFITQFPDALSLMTSSLRAGHSFQSCLTVVASEAQAPMGTEFSLVVKDFNLGVPVRDALERFMFNMDNLPDVRMFVTAVLIQRESGGNLAEILDKLGYTIRERFKLKGQVSSLTAQSRLTGYCIGAAPIVVIVVLMFISPSYLKPLFEDNLGKLALMVALLMQITGFVVIKRIVDIRI